ncbi:MAG: ATP-dependent Clp protease proteolytic subunit [Acidimicrobiales bacterium]
MTGPPTVVPEGWGGRSWDDELRARLFDRRVVVVAGPLDQPTSTRVASELMTLDADGDEPVELRLTSAEGDLDAALAVMDVVDLLGVTVRASCLGLVGGPAIGVAARCPIRSSAPHCRFRLCEPAQQVAGRAAELAALVALRQERWELFCERVADAVGRPTGDVRAEMATGRFLDADEALAWGLLTEVPGPAGSLRRLPTGPR